MKQSLMREIATAKPRILTWITFTPDWIAEVMNVPEEHRFMRFDAGPVIGLARLKGKHLEILAIESSMPGSGHFGAFVARLRTECDSITFWQIWNPWLPSVLERYGFKGVHGTDYEGKGMTGMRWKK